MTEATLEKEAAMSKAKDQDCPCNTCGVEMDEKDRNTFIHESNLKRFCDAIEADLDLKIFGTNAQIIEDEEKEYEPDTLFIIRNEQIQEECYGAYVKIPVKEVMDMPLKGSIHDLLLKIKGEKNPRSLEGVTRIVGYYSRVHDWNKSKIGELRDRNNGIYALSGSQNPDHGAERQKTIDSL